MIVPMSVLSLFTIGIGPSSSHTIGPMRAARAFVQGLIAKKIVAQTAKITVSLYGSLALTGKGHGSDKAILLGLAGYTPEGIPTREIEDIVSNIRKEQRIVLFKTHSVSFDESRDMAFYYAKVLPRHANGIRFEAFNTEGGSIEIQTYYSIGGGAILRDGEDEPGVSRSLPVNPPFAYRSGDDLLLLGKQSV